MDSPILHFVMASLEVVLDNPVYVTQGFVACSAYLVRRLCHFASRYDMLADLIEY
jgi:hypothetical protein